MDTREVLFKLSLDTAFVTLLWLLRFPLFASLILAHTINMFINGHYFVLMKNIGRLNTEPKKFITYIQELGNRVQKLKFIDGGAGYGSLSRNEYKLASDFDLRIFPRDGFVNWFKAVMWVFTERLRALAYSFPLDIYAFDLSVIDYKMRADEPPIIFADPKQRLAEKYLNRVSSEEFIKAFKEKYARD